LNGPVRAIDAAMARICAPVPLVSALQQTFALLGEVINDSNEDGFDSLYPK
jgi:hypothetical protein